MEIKNRRYRWARCAILVGSAVLLISGPLRADEDITKITKQKAASLLHKGKYQELDELAASVKAKGYNIAVTYPELTSFYSAFDIPRRANEAEWLKRKGQLEAWATASPNSVSARTALADWWIGYGWKARGSGYANTVTQEGWKALRERLEKATEVLREVPFEKANDPQYFKVWCTVALGQGWTPAKARRYFNYGVQTGKGHYPLYSGYAYWLLPKWYGERGEWEAFVTEVAETFPGTEGDILYANLVQSNSDDYGDDLFKKCKVDYPRIKNGLLAVISGSDSNEAIKAKNRLCYLAAIKGDYEVARPLFFEIRGNSYSRFFDGIENLRRLRALSGAQAMIDSAYDLEKKGDLEGAEKAFASFTRDPKTNAWLRYFYQRQGMEEKFRSVKLRYDLDADPATASPEKLADLCRLAPLMGQWEKAEAAAKRFDSLRPWNLTGKTTLLLVASRNGDQAQVEALGKAIIETKSDRPSFQMVQAIIRGEKSWDKAWELLKVGEPYDKQSALAIGIWYLASGKGDLARTAFQAIAGIDEREEDMIALSEALLFGSLASMVTTPR